VEGIELRLMSIPTWRPERNKKSCAYHSYSEIRRQQAVVEMPEACTLPNAIKSTSRIRSRKRIKRRMKSRIRSFSYSSSSS
jgi:hypothetical protein